jgi:large subunit ribosomal protein L29
MERIMKIAKRAVAKVYATKDHEKTETAQLQHDLLERRKHLFALRAQAVTEKLEDPSQLRKTRKEIARIMTTLRQREAIPQKATKTTEAQTSAK